jgi:hypothetical protein
MRGNRIVGLIIEVLLLFSLGLICVKTYSGDPSDISYNEYVMNPFVYIYLGLYAMKVIFNRSVNNLKYLFYVAFGIFIIGMRFYEKLNLMSSVKYICLGTIVALVIYHILEITGSSKKNSSETTNIQ